MKQLATLIIAAAVASSSAAWATSAQTPAPPTTTTQGAPPKPAAPRTATTQGGRGGGASATLSVEVTDRSGNRLSDVQVAVGGPVDRTGNTDNDGRIVFRSMRAGTYRLRFERSNYVTLEREIVMRGAVPAEVSAALSAAPEKTVAPIPEPAPAPVPAPAPKASNRVVEPRSLSIPDFLDSNLIGGGEPQRTTLLACAEGGTARLVQVRDPLNDQQHADADEMLYVVAGSGVVRMRNQETRMNPGHFALVPRGVPHSIRREGRNPLIVVSIFAGPPCAEGAAGPR